MATATVNQIENEFAELSREEQVIVLQRLMHQFRLGVVGLEAKQREALDAAGNGPPREWERAAAERRAAEADLLNEVW
jgi:hypothetical protein